MSYLYYTQLLHPLPLAWRRLTVWMALLVLLAAASSGWVDAFGPALSVGGRLALLASAVAICGWLAPWKSSAYAD
jgi:hypothetical protein